MFNFLLNITSITYQKSSTITFVMLESQYIQRKVYMNKTNLAFKSENEFSTTPDWNYFVSEISKVFRFSKEETDWFSNCKTAQLIATIPFAAECIEPERTAIAHLCIYVAEIKGFQKYYAHQPSDDFDIYNRLAFISTFEGGNKKIIEEGMDILALIMIEGYHKSMKKDEKENIYNPFVSKTWNYNKIKKQIKSKLTINKSGKFTSFVDPENYVWG